MDWLIGKTSKLLDSSPGMQTGLYTAILESQRDDAFTLQETEYVTRQKEAFFIELCSVGTLLTLCVWMPFI